MRELRRLLMGLASAAAWPLYLALVGYAVKAGPWPRDVAWPASVALLGLAGTLLARNGGRMALRTGGWADQVLQAPKGVIRQIRRVVTTLVIAGSVLLLPELLLSQGLIAPGGRPISASSLGRLLILGFELTCWILALRLLRPSSPLLEWLGEDPTRLGLVGRHQRAVARAILAALALVLVLDGAGFRFTSRRLAYSGGMTIVLVAACWEATRLLLRAIEHHAWRWRKTAEEQPATAPTATPAATSPEAIDEADDPRRKLRALARVAVAFVGVLVAARIWNVDLALFRYIGEQPLWGPADRPVAVGDVVKMALILFVTIGAWRYLQTFFTIAIFPRMPDDPGIRFAVVTLCRYLVLAVGLLAGLSAIHLGLEKIGVVLAALGVGLGFGLQEIISNFVSGIILLLERPIRVGDLVSVGEMTGKVDRINIRATTIINGDNQSIIIPNRQFITGNLVNWTHNDKILRLSIRVNVALGTDADKVSDLLLAIAHADVDVLNNPVPAAFLDAIGDFALKFVLHTHVPDPSLLARVRHRLYGEVQRRFEDAGISISPPIQEIRVHAIGREGLDDDGLVPPRHHGPRIDAGEGVPPAPRLATLAGATARGPLPAPAEDCHRGVDE